MTDNDKKSSLPSPAVIPSRNDPDKARPIDFTDEHFRRHMTPEDEKRTDHQGRPAVLGLPWSQAGTGLFLMIGCVQRRPGTKGVEIPMDGFWGALELPVDLATDALKKKYVTEWICAEVDKAIGQAGL